MGMLCDFTQNVITVRVGLRLAESVFEQTGFQKQNPFVVLQL